MAADSSSIIFEISFAKHQHWCSGMSTNAVYTLRHCFISLFTVKSNQMSWCCFVCKTFHYLHYNRPYFICKLPGNTSYSYVQYLFIKLDILWFLVLWRLCNYSHPCLRWRKNI